MHSTPHAYRAPILTALGLTLVLCFWTFWSWQGYQERSQDWRRQRLQDNLETVHAVIEAMAASSPLNWHQVETILGGIANAPRTIFAAVVHNGTILAQTGNLPDTSGLLGPRGEFHNATLRVTWVSLRGRHLPGPEHPILYLGMRSAEEHFGTSWFWKRQGPLFFSVLACVLAATIVWTAMIRRRFLTEQLANARARAAHLEELALAAAGLAHETKNPLGIIMGLAQQIAAHPGIPSESLTMVHHILDEVDKASSRLGHFLHFARQREARLERLDLRTACTEAAELLAPDFEAARVHLEVEVSPGHILADPVLLRQILTNLLLNSLHASTAETLTRIRSEQRRGRIRLLIEDQGQGIPAELLPNVFKPYVTGSPSGHGLGLAIVQRLAEAQGWTVKAHSRPGHGTTMTLSGIMAARKP